MGIVLMRIFFNIWSLGAFLFLINTFSHLIFIKRLPRAKFRCMLMALWFPLIWPLSICSPEGRKVLFGKFHQL